MLTAPPRPLAPLPPNESRLSGGRLSPPSAQHLPYPQVSSPSEPPARGARRCRRWLGGNLPDFLGVEPAAQVPHRQNRDPARLDPVDDPVVAEQQLTDIRPTQLRHQPTPFGKPAQRPGSGKQPVHPTARGDRGVPGNVGRGLRRPLETLHAGSVCA